MKAVSSLGESIMIVRWKLYDG